MDEFFYRYGKLIKIGLYGIIIIIGLSILNLITKISPVWINILTDLWYCMIPFLVAFVLAYLIHPLITKIDYLRLPRGLSVFIFYIIIFGSLYLTISWFLPTIIKEIRDLILHLPLYLSAIEEQILLVDIKFDLNLYETFSNKYEEVMTQLGQHIQSIVGFLFNCLSSIIGSFISFIIIPIALFYFLKDYEKLLYGVLKLVPKKYRHHAISLGSLLDDSLGSYLRGVFLIMLTLSLLGTVLFMVAGVKYSLLFGVLVGITDFIPFVGPIIGAIPVIFFALSISWKKVLTVIIIVAILQVVEANILQPLIIGRNLDLHPIMVMLLMLVAGTIFGFQGVLFAFPIFIVAKTMYTYFRNLKHKD